MFNKAPAMIADEVNLVRVWRNAQSDVMRHKLTKAHSASREFYQ